MSRHASRRASDGTFLAAAASFLLMALVIPCPPAHACDSATCSLLTRGGNGLLPKKTLKVDLTMGWTDQGILLSGSREVTSVYRPRVFLERGTVVPNFHRDIDGSDRSVQLDLTYGLGSRFNLTASLPLSLRHVHDVSHGSPLVEEFGTTGFGDVLLGVRWAVGPRRLVGGLAVKTPTGRYKIGGEFGGGIQDPALQPGTGAFDVVGSLQYSWSTDVLRLQWTAAGSYQRTTANSFDYRFGDQTIAILAASRTLSRRLSLSIQAKLYHQEHSRFVGKDVPSTGGTFGYLTPGLQFTAGRGVTLYSFLLFVPYRYVYDAQLAPKISVLAGVSKTFH